MTTMICKRCGDKYEKGYDHKCLTNEYYVNRSLYVGDVKGFVKETSPFMRVSPEVKKELTKLKKFKRDSYSEVIKRLLKKEVKN